MQLVSLRHGYAYFGAATPAAQTMDVANTVAGCDAGPHVVRMSYYHSEGGNLMRRINVMSAGAGSEASLTGGEGPPDTWSLADPVPVNLKKYQTGNVSFALFGDEDDTISFGRRRRTSARRRLLSDEMDERGRVFSPSEPWETLGARMSGTTRTKRAFAAVGSFFSTVGRYTLNPVV
jgi:hypothetical protein